MADDFISRNEFNGFAKTVQDGFSRLQDNLTQVSAKLDTLVNGRILAFLANGAKTFFVTPSVDAPVINCLPTYARDLSPFGNTRRFPANSYNPVVPSVPTLLLRGCPSAILWAIVLVAIYPVN